MRKFLQESVIVLASCVNYACIFLMTFLFKLDIPIFLLGIAMVSFLFSLIVLNIKRSIIYVCVAVVIGAIISIVLLVSPPLAYGEIWAVRYQLESVVQSVGRLLIFAFAFSFVGSILGSFVGDAS